MALFGRNIFKQGQKHFGQLNMDSFSVYCRTVESGRKPSKQWNINYDGMVVYVHWVDDIIGIVNIMAFVFLE